MRTEIQLRERITELEQQLEEAKQVKLDAMSAPAWGIMASLGEFLEKTLEADRPMVCNLAVPIENNEEIVILHFWAATTHDSPISRAQELVGKVAELEARNAALVKSENLHKSVVLKLSKERGDALRRNDALVEAAGKARDYIKASLPDQILLGSKDENYYFAYHEINQAIEANG